MHSRKFALKQAQKGGEYAEYLRFKRHNALLKLSSMVRNLLVDHVDHVDIVVSTCCGSSLLMKVDVAVSHFN